MNRDKTIIPLLAWRNVTKNKRRTTLTLLTAVVGTMMIIFFNALATGGHDQMIEDAVAANTGHIQIHEKGFWESRILEYAFVPEKRLIKRLNTDKRINGFSRRINAAGLLSFRDTTTGAIIQGVEHDKEKKVTNTHEYIQKGGRYLLSDDTNQIVMGYVLARKLGAGIGDTVYLISQGFDGSIAAEGLTISGLFETGNPEYDGNLLLMNFKQAAETFSMKNYISAIALRLHKTDLTEEVTADLLAETDRNRIEIMSWDKLMPELVQFIIIDDAGAYIFDFILLMIVAFGILNTMQMAVFERIREFGIMLAIGTSPSQVLCMVLTEAFFISILGIITGVSLGSAISYYFTVNPIDYSAYAEEISIWGISTTFYPARLTLLNIAVTSALVIFLSVGFSYFPARRASRLKPIEAIRQL